MQEYLVMIESSDYISVDAESESEAEEKATSIFLSDGVRECKATVIGPPQPVETTESPTNMPVQEIEVVSKTDRREAEALLARVDSLLDDSRATQDHLARNFIEIGIALLEVDKTKAWTLRCHSSDAYVKSCESRFGRSRTVLYGYKSVAENLLPHMAADKLLEIGISKAQPLAQHVKHAGNLSAGLLADAENPEVGVEQFRASLAEARHEKPDTGRWFEFGGAFLTSEEKEEIERGFRAAENQEPLPENTKEWVIRKIVMQRLVAEFLSTYPETE